MNMLLGKVHMSVNIIGIIEQELELHVGATGNYYMYFLIKSYDIKGVIVLIPCEVDGEEAKNLYDDYRKKDIIVLWGQFHHNYNPQRSQRTTLLVKVLSHSMFYDFPIQAGQPQVAKEKQELMDEIVPFVYEYVCEHRSKPSKEEIDFWATDRLKKKNALKGGER